MFYYFAKVSSNNVHPITVKTYSDNLYNIADNSKYKYYLFFEADHISSVIANELTQQIMCLKVFTAEHTNFLGLSYDELKQITPLLDDMSSKYKDIRVVITSSACTLVPESLLNVVETDAYYALNHKLIPQSQILYCKMHVQHTASIFNVRNELVKLIRFNLPLVDVYHASLLFIKAIEQQNFEQAANKIHVNVHSGYIELLNFDKSIKFYNTFPIATETEIIYYLLAAAEQLQISHGLDVVLYGNLPVLSELNELLVKYVRSVQFGIKPKKLNYPVSFNQFPEHQFFIESSALLCE